MNSKAVVKQPFFYCKNSEERRTLWQSRSIEIEIAADLKDNATG